MTEVNAILGAMAEQNRMEPEKIPEGTYKADDGLLHCKVCKQPVQHRLEGIFFLWRMMGRKFCTVRSGRN